MYVLMPIVFGLGIIAITLENKIKINKSAIALFMCITLWVMLASDAHYILVQKENPEFNSFIERTNVPKQTIKKHIVDYIKNEAVIQNLGDVSQTLFFVMCTMLIVRIVDKHGGFRVITPYLKTSNKRRLLWNMSFASFFFSALLDNLAAAILLITILRKLVPDKTDRMKYACMIVIAANAGGSWSPIGDVTTLLLWTGGNITPLHQITHLILPALMNLLVPLIIAHFWLFKRHAVLRQYSEITRDDEYISHIPLQSRRIIFIIGILSLALVPVFQILTGLPAFMCVMLGLVLLWGYTDLMYWRIHDIRDSNKLTISELSHSIDIPTIFFFLGILMAVSALETGGQLAVFADFLSSKLKEPLLISTVIGGASSVLDNVALVAATIDMYPLANSAAVAADPSLHYFVTDGSFWTFLAYCGVTGGSLLIIGSATGVTVMGMEKIGFMYYFKRFTPLALIGYLAGVATFLLIG